jgi:hypothetical protein
MTGKQPNPELPIDRDLARQYQELCRLRAELKRCSPRLRQSRPGRGEATANDRRSRINSNSYRNR